MYEGSRVSVHPPILTPWKNTSDWYSMSDWTTLRAIIGSHLYFNAPWCALFGIPVPNQCFGSLSVVDADRSLISSVLQHLACLHMTEFVCDFSSVMSFSYCCNDRTWPLHSQRSDLFVTDLYGDALYLPSDTQIFYARLEACPRRAFRWSSPAATQFSKIWERGCGKPQKRQLGDVLHRGHLHDYLLIWFLFMPSNHIISFNTLQIKGNKCTRGNLRNYQILALKESHFVSDI